MKWEQRSNYTSLLSSYHLMLAKSYLSDVYCVWKVTSHRSFAGWTLLIVGFGACFPDAHVTRMPVRTVNVMGFYN